MLYCQKHAIVKFRALVILQSKQQMQVSDFPGMHMQMQRQRTISSTRQLLLKRMSLATRSGMHAREDRHLNISVMELISNIVNTAFSEILFRNRRMACKLTLY